MFPDTPLTSALRRTIEDQVYDTTLRLIEHDKVPIEDQVYDKTLRLIEHDMVPASKFRCPGTPERKLM